MGELDRYWERLDRIAQAEKNSHGALLCLSKSYREWDSDQRSQANEAFQEWLNSENVRKRFDALVLIEEFGIVEARSGLLTFLCRLEGASGPEAEYERRRVREVLSALGFAPQDGQEY